MSDQLHCFEGAFVRTHVVATTCVGSLLVGSILTGCSVNPSLNRAGDAPLAGVVAAVTFNPPINTSIVPLPRFGNPGSSQLWLLHKDPAKNRVFNYSSVELNRMDFRGGKFAISSKEATYFGKGALQKYPNRVTGDRPDLVNILPGKNAVFTAWNERFREDGYEYPFQVIGPDGLIAQGDLGMLIENSTTCDSDVYAQAASGSLTDRSQTAHPKIFKLDVDTSKVLEVAKTHRKPGDDFTPAGPDMPCADGVTYQVLTNPKDRSEFRLQKFDTVNKTGERIRIVPADDQDREVFNTSKIRGPLNATVHQGKLYWGNAHTGKVFVAELDGSAAKLLFTAEPPPTDQYVDTVLDLRDGRATLFGAQDDGKYFLRTYALLDGQELDIRQDGKVPDSISSGKNLRQVIGLTH